MLHVLTRTSRRIVPIPEQGERGSGTNQRQILVPLAVLDLVDSDGVDDPEGAVLQPKGDDMFDCVEDLVPGSAECLGRFLPRKPPRPAGQK